MQQTRHGIPAYRKQQIVMSVAALLPLSRCCFYDISEDLTSEGHVIHDGNTRWIAPYRSHFQEIDPFAPSKLLAKRGRRVHGTGGLYELSEIRKTDYYQGFMRPMGQLHKVDLLLVGQSKIPLAGLRLSRTPAQGPFTYAEGAMLEKLLDLLDLAVGAPRVSYDFVVDLTAREREVAHLLAKGYANKEICRLLKLQLPTVKSHVRNIFRKSGATNRADLVSRLLA